MIHYGSGPIYLFVATGWNSIYIHLDGALKPMS